MREIRKVSAHSTLSFLISSSLLLQSCRFENKFRWIVFSVTRGFTSTIQKSSPPRAPHCPDNQGNIRAISYKSGEWFRRDREFFDRNTSRFLFDRSRHRSRKNGGPHECGRRNFLQKGYSLSHRVSRRPEISKNSMFLSCFAGVFFVICFDFYLNKFGATVDFQSDVEIDGDSHAVFSTRKLSQKLSPS